MTLQEALQVALVHHQQGRLSEAERIYRQILAQDPNNADALQLLGVVAHQVGKHDAAIELISRAVAFCPDIHDFHLNLGEAQRAAGRLTEAIASFRRAIALSPDRADDYTKLGAALVDAGHMDEAILAIRHAVALDPADAMAHNNLGTALRATGSTGDAIAAFQLAKQLAPNLAQPYCNLANIYREQGSSDAALAELEQAFRINPNLAEAHLSLGMLQLGSGDLDAAEQACRRAIELKPDFAGAYAGLGNVIRDQARLDETIEAYRTTIRLKPDDHQTHSSLIYSLLFHPGYDAPAVAAENSRWNDLHARPFASSIRPHDNDRSPQRRLRIGYVSPDFRRTSMAYFLVPLLESHDHGEFEVYCYSTTLRGDAITERCRAAASVWRDVAGTRDAQLAEMIRRDQIDILVDLSMHMRDGRSLVFARKPAPVQTTWLAYPGSSGMETVDYRITDRHLDPPERDANSYSESSVRLPDSWACYDPLTDSSPEPNELPLLASGFITFGSFHSFVKINDDVLNLWAQLLRALPQSRLLMTAPAGSTRDRLVRRFEQAQVEPKRIEFTPRTRHADYLAWYHRIDVLLDPFPHCGFTTTCDAMWMGVPTVSLAGPMAQSRGGASFLTTVGLPQFIAADTASYINICRDVAVQPDRLSELRRTLRERLKASPPMNPSRFARNLERAYRQMWHRYCRGEPAVEFFLE